MIFCHSLSPPILWLWWSQGGHLIHRCISEADIRAWWVVGLQGHSGKISESWTAVMLLQRSSEAPAPSLVLSLFILKAPFGVNCILVHFICMSCLFHKLWGPKGGVTTFYLGSFLWLKTRPLSLVDGATGLTDCWTNEYFKANIIIFFF